MCSHTRISFYLVGTILFFAAFAWIFGISFAEDSRSEKPPSEKPDGNNKCYVCHPSLKTEEITTAHLDIAITCDECHGPSVEHMQDEMLMTEPDLLFGRAEVDKMCSNPTCHNPGGDRLIYSLQDHKNPVAAEDFYKKWRGRTRPNGRTVTPDSVCTDCHGKHNLDRPIAPQSEEQPAQWVAVFNGRDLAGWRSSGDACWRVSSGQIIATLHPDANSGDLWTEAEYEDYLLAITFRATWPIHAGIWLRAAGSNHGPRIEILDPTAGAPIAFTGSVWVTGKGLALVNLRDDLVDRESWNTISVKVQSDKVHVWLNGEEVGAVRIRGRASGRIGLHLERHPASKATELHIREVLIQRLTEPQQSAAK